MLQTINSFLNNQLSKNIFCSYRTIISKLRRLDIKYSYHNGNYKLFSKKDNISIHVSEKKRTLRFYRGIKQQLVSLASEYFINEVNFTDNDIVIDVGANIGELGLYFQSLNRNIIYYGIEPSPIEYSCLKKNINSCNLFNIGAWNISAMLEFYLLSETADSSLFDTGKFTKKIKIPVNRLDNIIPCKKIKLLKVEAEGAEPEVLEGAGKILNYCDFVTIDCTPERSKHKIEVEGEVKKIMQNSGFKLIKKNNKRLILFFENQNKND